MLDETLPEVKPFMLTKSLKPVNMYSVQNLLDMAGETYKEKDKLLSDDYCRYATIREFLDRVDK